MARKLHRRSIRLKDYDYSRESAYFVTLVTQNRISRFGNIEREKMILNRIGEIVSQCWSEIKVHFTNAELDEFVVMPNHFHGIILLFEKEKNSTGTACRAPTIEKFGKPVSGSFPTIIRSFKSASTKLTNEFCNTPRAKLWQRNYYEHIIRNETDLNNIRNYIFYNPLKWAWDKENPDRIE